MHRCQEAAPSEQEVEHRATWWFGAERGIWDTRSTPARRTAARARLTPSVLVAIVELVCPPRRASTMTLSCARGTWRSGARQGDIRGARQRGAQLPARGSPKRPHREIVELVLPRAVAGGGRGGLPVATLSIRATRRPRAPAGLSGHCASPYGRLGRLGGRPRARCWAPALAPSRERARTCASDVE